MGDLWFKRIFWGISIAGMMGVAVMLVMVRNIQERMIEQRSGRIEGFRSATEQLQKSQNEIIANQQKILQWQEVLKDRILGPDVKPTTKPSN